MKLEFSTNKTLKQWIKKGDGGEPHTFIPQTPISISHLPLSDLSQIKHSDAQPNVMQNLVGVNCVDFVNKRLVGGDTELVWFDRDGILTKRKAKSHRNGVS